MVVLVCLPEIGYEYHFSNPQIRCELFLDYPIYGYCSIQPYCPCVSLAFAVASVEYKPVDAGFDKRYFRHVCHESVVSPVGRGLASFTKVLGSMVSDRLSDTVMLAMLTFAVFMVQMKPFRQFLNENPSIETGVMNVLTSVWLYVGIFICIVAVVWFFCTNCIEDKEFYGQHLGRFCLDYYDEREILVRILYPVYLVLLFYATVCLHIRFPRYGKFDGLGGLVALCIG